ncbi:hypothetical protein FB45DRAFT_859903 [Roridomyces roridus]|uniref:Uncharacterized protein n=1 Tax=Roridomyces roridus TaxID=1738132 RepID=A0AAD7G314_9AGAR|nr:hypothetical protein FB45DRAFT_859903 [Roridomyces roridus]
MTAAEGLQLYAALPRRPTGWFRQSRVTQKTRIAGYSPDTTGRASLPHLYEVLPPCKDNIEVDRFQGRDCEHLLDRCGHGPGECVAREPSEGNTLQTAAKRKIGKSLQEIQIVVAVDYEILYGEQPNESDQVWNRLESGQQACKSFESVWIRFVLDGNGKGVSNRGNGSTAWISPTTLRDKGWTHERQTSADARKSCLESTNPNMTSKTSATSKGPVGEGPEGAMDLIRVLVFYFRDDRIGFLVVKRPPEASPSRETVEIKFSRRLQRIAVSTPLLGESGSKKRFEPEPNRTERPFSVQVQETAEPECKVRFSIRPGALAFEREREIEPKAAIFQILTALPRLETVVGRRLAVSACLISLDGTSELRESYYSAWTIAGKIRGSNAFERRTERERSAFDEKCPEREPNRTDPSLVGRQYFGHLFRVNELRAEFLFELKNDARGSILAKIPQYETDVEPRDSQYGGYLRVLYGLKGTYLDMTDGLTPKHVGAQFGGSEVHGMMGRSAEKPETWADRRSGSEGSDVAVISRRDEEDPGSWKYGYRSGPTTYGRTSGGYTIKGEVGYGFSKISLVMDQCWSHGSSDPPRGIMAWHTGRTRCRF